MFYEIEEIKRRRKKLGITQKKLAELVGVSQPLIARIESGDLDPKLSLVKKIFEVLGELEGRGITAKKIMTTDIIFASPDELIVDTIDVMREKGISQLPVVKDGANLGCITESSILRVIMMKGLDGCEDMRVRDVMEEPLPEISPNESLDSISKMLLNNPALLVVEEGKIVGIVTKHDVMKAMREK
ncbi:CBS domain-containing protein [Geoglobus acetivorans]|uniref:Putative transcriptional regulator with C-terminal CBS domain n=1 Tax=Geoglobus acetivorans TaxID=565033 RepID=A0A0A7GH79_GEOAI|nr:putative transcriptional regulator with C-terminal CBS domain [Geoglobus acetivorans]